MEAFFPLVSTAIIYLLICMVLGWALRKVVARFDLVGNTNMAKGEK